MPAFAEQNDDEMEQQAKVMADASKRAKEKQKLAAQAAEEAKKEKLRKEEEAKAAEAKAWEEAKVAAAEREAKKAEEEELKKQTLSPAELVLQSIDMLVIKASEADEAEQRADRLEKLLGDTAKQMKTRARRKSKDLQEQMAKMMEGNLEAAFKQFDTDGSGSLDAEELTNAYKAAGMPVDEVNLAKCMKMLDTNGDGVIDFDEFKQIAVKMKMMTTSDGPSTPRS